MLDNTIAGGMGDDQTPLSCIIKEAFEEASLDSEYVKKYVVSTGTVSYFYVREAVAGGEAGLLQPEVEYVFDLPMRVDGPIPKPCDTEVEEHILMTVNEVQSELAEGNFKPNCAVVIIDFFIRHGIITSENEPKYLELCTRLHRSLEFPSR